MKYIYLIIKSTCNCNRIQYRLKYSNVALYTYSVNRWWDSCKTEAEVSQAPRNTHKKPHRITTPWIDLYEKNNSWHVVINNYYITEQEHQVGAEDHAPVGWGQPSRYGDGQVPGGHQQAPVLPAVHDRAQPRLVCRYVSKGLQSAQFLKSLITVY